MTYGTVNVDSVVNSDGVTSGGLYGFKNRIINGAMMIDQRNAGAAVTNGSGSTYFADRWLIYDGSGGSHFSVQQNKGSVTPPAGFKNYLGISTSSAVAASAGNNFTFNQYVEGLNVADLNWGSSNASAVTLSFWVYSSLTGTFAGVLQEDSTTAFYVYTYTISSANTWTKITINVPGPTIGTWDTTNGRGINVRWDLGMGSNFNTASPNAWSASSGYTVSGAQKVVGTLNATFYITGVQLEKGSTATSFDYRPYGTELALCQRYYQQITGNGVTTNYFGYAVAVSTYQAYITVPLAVTMRTSPTVAYTGSVYVSDLNSYDLALTAITTNRSNISFVSAVVTTTSGMTLYRPQSLWVSGASNNLNFSAEL